jgi:hypothetical protein
MNENLPITERCPKPRRAQGVGEVTQSQRAGAGFNLAGASLIEDPAKT